MNDQRKTEKQILRDLEQKREPSFVNKESQRCFKTSQIRLLNQNVRPKVVQERLGHATTATTLDIYSHVLPVGPSPEAPDKLKVIGALIVIG